MSELAWSEAPGGIEKQWAALRAADGEHHGRALTVNVIGRARDAAGAEAMGQCLWRIGRRHPARAFIVVPSSGPNDIRVAADPVGSELALLGMAPERAPSLVQPLLAADLPTVLVWGGGAPDENPDFERWSSLCDQVLVDAHRMGLDAEHLAALTHRHGHQLTDFTWTRLTPWRQLLCQGLESEPEAYRHIRRVSITAGHGEDPAGSLAATLFAGWMARQLQWTPEARLGSQAVRLQSPDGAPVTLRFQPCPTDERHGLLRRLVVEGEEGGDMSVVIQHRGEHLSMNVRGGGHLLGDWSGGGSARQEAELLSEELNLRGGDPLYSQSLELGLALRAKLRAEPA